MLFVLAFLSPLAYGQIFDFDKPNPYKKIFVETDNFDASYLNELEGALSSIKIDTIKFEVLNDLAYYWHTRNLSIALKYTEKGLELTSGKNNLVWNGRFQITKGAILLRQEKLDAAKIVLKEAETKVREEDLAFLNTQLGYIYERRGQLAKAADFALKSLSLGDKLNDKKAKGIAYSDLSNLLWKQGKYEEGLEYGLKSLLFFEERNIIDLDYDFTLYVVGNNYLRLKQYEKAKQYYERSIEIGERYGFYNNLSDVYISLVDLYAYRNQFSKAEAAGKNAIKYAYLLDNAFMLMRSYLAVGELQSQNGEHLAAIENIQKSIAVATPNFGDGFFLSKAYNSLGNAYAENEQYQEAYRAFTQYDSLNKIVFTAEADQRISQLQTEFNVAQKENTIKLQKTKLLQQQTNQNFIGLIAVFLFLILTVLFISFNNNRRKNILLRKKNDEKEFLLKEIHHRVKNNLEVVSSLLALQTAQIKDPKVASAMKESQNRVYSMSIIHKRLYQSEYLSSIEMKDYFINLGNHILDSFGEKTRIKIIYKMPELHLDVDTAVPLGLIVNELLTNSLKYAFPNKRMGEIIINLEKKSAYEIELLVKDNGIGQTEGEPVKGTGFGKKLIDLLNRQLDGTMQVIYTCGTQYLFNFKVNRLT
ncbi:Two-component sensor histidine kinase, contains HisKA and HATPase domains [Salegentibacter holothuriorum]|uniref:histidine kinase n=1 Tax=Salegentibacter holothuriorum TaxID=241145 RepID=A0A1T5CRX9_9FLAO|nr:histidine kinase dimerization/phosphoacceptor domain -containing protein [Salegentibacter holothuriorum]SKB62232.1 Two-component sensor histidine kinase, contains HisKA and HATPase domains [Salegentibacter holothuriorum]